TLYIFVALLALAGCSSDSSNNSETLDSGTNDGQGGSLAIFTLKGEYLYAVDTFGLNVFNIANASNPVLVNEVDFSFNIETLFGYKDYLYIGSRNGMFIYSIENPEFPVQLSSVEHFTACDPVVANGTYAFVTLWAEVGCGNFVNQLETYDVTDVEAPVLINTRSLTFPKGMGLYGDYLFVCDDEIKIFDVSDPVNSVLVHSIDRLAFDVIIHNDLLIAVGQSGIFQYQLDPENIESTTSLSEIAI
ncbi:MAG: LVIVD repeat-containing protein, partial [Marinirhabdus sp.]